MWAEHIRKRQSLYLQTLQESHPEITRLQPIFSIFKLEELIILGVIHVTSSHKDRVVADLEMQISFFEEGAAGEVGMFVA